MSSCCNTPESKHADATELTVALAGNPNSGKTTIFNALTGLRQKVANYPGVTVEKKTGRCKLAGNRRVRSVADPLDIECRSCCHRRPSSGGIVRARLWGVHLGINGGSREAQGS